MTIKTTTVPSQTHAQQQQDSQADRVMESFQKTMQVFLDVQKATMLAYLSGRGSLAQDHPDVGQSERPRHRNHENGTSHVTVSRHPEPMRNPTSPSRHPESTAKMTPVT